MPQGLTTVFTEPGKPFELETLPTPEIPDNLLDVNGSSGDTFILDFQNKTDDLFHVTSDNANRGWDPTAVTAFSNTLKVYDYWLNTHQRKSIDDKNKNLIVAIHYDNDYGNATWNGTLMTYGDGDGRVILAIGSNLDETWRQRLKIVADSVMT